MMSTDTMASSRRIHVIADPDSDPDLLSAFHQRFGGDGVELCSIDSSTATTPRALARQLGDVEVSVVVLGTCTWAKRAVDLQVAAALLPRADGRPGGLFAVTVDRNAERSKMPVRLKANVQSGYAALYRLPRDRAELVRWADAAAARRDQPELVRNGFAVPDADVLCSDTGDW
jgi:hypothetical protein